LLASVFPPSVMFRVKKPHTTGRFVYLQILKSLRMKNFIAFLAFVLAANLAKASTDSVPIWKPVVPNLIEDKYQSAGLSHLTGLLDEHININIEKRLLRIDSAILLSGFVKRPGSQTWIGEHVGKFLFSASRSYAYSHDKRLLRLMDDMVRKYIATQLPDGYLGTYLPANYWTEWDVWAHKYAILGLLEYYAVTGYPPALQAAEKAAGLICATFGNAPGQKDLNLAGHHAGMAPGSILEPMVDLYRYTKNNKYLEFSKYILSNWETTTGPKLLSGLQQYGRVTKVGNSKAYEMLSCFVGVLKYYKLTGDIVYLKALQTAWQDIVSNRLYITGTASAHELFNDDHKLPADTTDNMGEGCVTVTWIQFNQQLLQITGDFKYAAEIEKAIYNHLLAAENPATGCVSYYTPLQGRKPYKCDQGFSCCLSSVPRGISLIPGLVWGKINKEFSVIMYEAGEMKDSIVTADGSGIILGVKAVTDFPLSGTVMYTVHPSSNKKFTINFRVPEWSSNYTVSINGIKQVITTKGIVRLERIWKAGDKVNIQFEMPLQVIDGAPSYPGFIAFKRGPQVLALDRSLTRSQSHSLTINYNEHSKFSMSETKGVLPVNWIGKQAYAITINNDRQQKPFILVPYSDSGQQSDLQDVWIPVAVATTFK